MNINVAIIGEEGDICRDATVKLDGTISRITCYRNFDEVTLEENQISLVICSPTSLQSNQKLIGLFSHIPFLIVVNNKFSLNGIDLPIIDCINTSFSKEEIIFRIKNLIKQQKTVAGYMKQNEKLRLFFDKNRRKTIDLFGKHVDLKKAKKEIVLQKNKIEKQNRLLARTIEKKKRKTIHLFGKHVDLKKAKKEIEEINTRIKEQKSKLEKIIEKNRQKTIELFGKHIDLKKAKKEIAIQKSKIEKQNIAITDSIKYAGFIQNAVLPHDETMDEIFPDYMTFHIPRNIVSGDFYWCEKIGDMVYAAAADCTGHGVPGAFMSMLGISLLNEIAIRYKSKDANQLLELLKDKVISSLHQTGKIDEASDGMDIAFCMINQTTLQMQFAGAHNPVYIIRNNELIEIKGDRMPIGFSPRQDKPFTNHTFQLQADDVVYIFSDGYADQFGGEQGMKLRYRTFQQILLEIHKNDFNRQKEILMERFVQWKGNYDQIDDILVFGFRPKFKNPDIC